MSTTTNRSAAHWKRKAAMAIGRPELADASDEELEAAHDEHTESILKMMGVDDGASVPTPPHPGAVANESSQQRMALASTLVNEKVNQGLTYDEAFNLVLNSRPDLFQTKTVVHR
jgi:hypothetical protein